MRETMEKRYGLPTAICMVVGIVIGSGIFFKTESVLSITGGNVITGVLSLLIMGVIMFFCTYAFSLLSQKHEKANGVVDYADAMIGPKYAYYLGWFMTLIYTPNIACVLCWVSARYLGSLFGFGATSGEVLALACLVLVSCGFLNAVAPKLAGKLQVSTTVIKLIPLLLMAVAGTVSGLISGQLAENIMAETTSDVTAVGGLTASVVSLAFAFEGWILATSINAELRDAKKNMPRALIGGVIVIVAVFVLYYMGICGAVSVEELTAADGGAPLAFRKLFGNTVGALLTVFVVISCLGTTNGLMMANSRSIYALAVRGNGPNPKLFGKLDETSNMPVNSALFGMLTVAFWLVYFFGANLSTGWFGPFNFDSSELPIVALYAMYIPIFLKMYKDMDLSRAKRVIVPTLAILSCIVLAGCAVYSHGIAKYQAAAAEGKFSFPVLFFLIVFAVVMFVGRFFYHPAKETE